MPTKLCLVTATAIATFAITEYHRVRPLRKRAKANKNAALLTLSLLEARNETVDRLVKVMEEKDVKLDEFDLIALNFKTTE